MSELSGLCGVGSGSGTGTGKGTRFGLTVELFAQSAYSCQGKYGKKESEKIKREKKVQEEH